MAQGEFLLEVRCEEIPARMLQPAIRELASRVFEELMARGLTPREVETGFTPRRLALILKGLPPGESDRVEKQIGPPAKVAFDSEAMKITNDAGANKYLVREYRKGWEL